MQMKLTLIIVYGRVCKICNEIEACTMGSSRTDPASQYKGASKVNGEISEEMMTRLSCANVVVQRRRRLVKQELVACTHIEAAVKPKPRPKQKTFVVLLSRLFKSDLLYPEMTFIPSLR